MPVVNPTSTSPPPREATMSKVAPSPPPPTASVSGNGNGNNSSTSHQVGARQATRSRTRTRQAQPPISNAAGPSRGAPPPLSRYSSEDHPLSTHKLAAKGYHSFQCLGIPFHVKRRYTFLRELGIGAYGCVALARDHLLDCNVAIKKVTRVFERDVLARRALREVAVLRHIGLCDNVTALLDFDTTFIEFNEIYLIMEASEADLSQIIRSGQVLSDAHLQYFVAQLLRGVRYMHAANIIHRDLKPGNLLVNADCQLKLCDFGLARAYAASEEDDDVKSTEPKTPSPASDENSSSMEERRFPDSPKDNLDIPTFSKIDSNEERFRNLQTTALNFPGGPLTEYVATRWYRAPEIMLCFKKGYGEQIDMWSVGCILAELLGGKPIFAGKDYVDQIARINNVLGSPNVSTIAKIGSDRAKTYVESLPNMPAVPFAKLYPSASEAAIDMLSKMLCWDPDDRISAEEALQHPWLKAYHKSNYNWSPPRPFDRFEEVELLKTIPDFRMGLESESEEMKAELEALQAEAEQEQEDEESSIDDDPSTSTSNNDTDESRADSSSSDAAAAAASSSSTAARSSRMTRSISSPSASPIPTPSSLATSGNETSPMYETDLTSASAPHSVTGSNSAKRGRSNRVMDGLGLIQSSSLFHPIEDGRLISGMGGIGQDGEEDANRERRALDETLANHGLLCGDDRSQVELLYLNRSKYRRRALTNAPSRLVTLKRVRSEGNLRSLPRSKDVMDAVVDIEETKTTDIIQRSPLQREEHPHVTDFTTDTCSWLALSSVHWANQSGSRTCHTHSHGFIGGGGGGGDDALTSREGSDTTAIGFQGPSTANTVQHSPLA